MASDDLRATVESLQQRVAELESEVETLSGRQASALEFGDARDGAVLDELQPGQVVTLQGLQRLYRTHTDIRNAATLKSRIKDLVRHGPFEGSNPWQYTGGDDGGE